MITQTDTFKTAKQKSAPNDTVILNICRNRMLGLVKKTKTEPRKEIYSKKHYENRVRNGHKHANFSYIKEKA